MGDLGHKLADQLIEELGNIDILLIPVGGFYTIDAKEAVEVIHQIEPRIVIPIFRSQCLNELLKFFPVCPADKSNIVLVYLIQWRHAIWIISCK